MILNNLSFHSHEFSSRSISLHNIFVSLVHVGMECINFDGTLSQTNHSTATLCSHYTSSVVSPEVVIVTASLQSTQHFGSAANDVIIQDGVLCGGPDKYPKGYFHNCLNSTT